MALGHQYQALTADRTSSGRCMRITTTLASLALAVWAGTGSAQWREGGKPVEDTAWRKAWGPYGAMLFLTDKPDELFAAWGKPGAGVPVSTTEIAKRGEAIVGVVFFSGCTANGAGVCDTEASFQVFKPDGSAYGPEEKTELWTRPPPSEGQLQLSIGAIGVRIEPEDPTGSYLVRARLRDRVSHAGVELTRSFRVAE